MGDPRDADTPRGTYGGTSTMFDSCDFSLLYEGAMAKSTGNRAVSDVFDVTGNLKILLEQART